MKEMEKKKDGIDKEISQKDSVKRAEEELNNSLFFYHQILEKLQNDNICYSCKKELKDKKGKIVSAINHIIPVRTCDKGLSAFVAVCNECFQKECKKKVDVQKDKKEE